MGAHSKEITAEIVGLSRRVKDAALTIGAEETDAPEFLHAVLCQLGLPRSEPEGREFTRTTGGASLLIEAGKWFDGTQYQQMPLPYGTRPRLALLHICSEAIRRQSPDIEVASSASDFLKRIGIAKGGESMAAFKRQMLALAACRMQISYRTETRVVNVKCDPIRKFDAWMQKGEGQVGLWAGEITLSKEFYDTLAEHAVPLDPRAIHALQNSALALDIYTWLAHRLRRIRSARGLVLHWKSLREQFGQEYGSDKDFKREFTKALQKAQAVYPDARIDAVRGGIKLFPSPGPIRKRQVVVALPSPDAAPASTSSLPPPPPKAIKSVPFKADMLVSTAALEQIGEIAPGWDKYYLEAQYKEFVSGLGEMPRDRDKAFLGWVRKFTKGRRV